MEYSLEKSNNPNKELGERVKKVRERLGLTQSKFAEKLDISDNYVSMVEGGARKISRKLARRIVQLSPSTSIGWLMGESDYETEDDEWAAERDRSQKMEVMWEMLLRKVASQAGYTFEQRHISSWDEFLQCKENYIFTDDRGRETGFSWFDVSVNNRNVWGIQSLQFDIFDYAAFRLRKMIEMKRNFENIVIDFGDNTDNRREENG